MNINGHFIKAPKLLNIKSWKVNSSKSTIDSPKDTFEKTKDADMTSNDNLQFKKVKIQFYPEDVERMKNMSLEERIKFKQQLKAENRYIVLDDEPKSDEPKAEE